MGRVVWGLLGIYIPFVAFDHNNDDTHILSEEVWIAVKTFSSQTLDFTTIARGVSLEVYLTQFEAYETVLLKVLEEFTIEMVTLMRLASGIRKPFFGRTVAIIMMWEVLTTCDRVKKETGARARRDLIK